MGAGPGGFGTPVGWLPFQEWPGGRSWRHGAVYLVLEQSPALSGSVHDRLAPGLNHVAFAAPGRAEVDLLTAAAPDHGWHLLFADRHPHAGGPVSYAAYFQDEWGYESRSRRSHRPRNDRKSPQ